MEKIDYLKEFTGFHKYDDVKSILVLGNTELHPKYSIVIPTYKRPDLLKSALNSCLNQMYTNFTITVVDNEEGDLNSSKTYELIKSIHNERIIYYKNERNIGIYANTLRAFELADSEYVTLLNDDDLLHPLYLQVLDKFVSRYKVKGLIGAMPCNFIGDKIPQPVFKSKNEIICLKITPALFYHDFCITSPGTTFKKENLSNIYNPYEDLLMGDQIMQYKSIRKYGLYRIEAPLAFYRHSRNATLKNDVIISMMYNMCKLKEQVAKSSPLLWLYHILFKKEIYFEYVRSFVCGWHKEHLLLPIMKKLGIENYPLRFGRKMYARNFVMRFFSRLKKQWPDKCKIRL